MTGTEQHRPPTNTRPRRRRRHLLAAWSRWLHIYLSMFAFAVILFFSVTGLTLNHPDWFFAETAHQVSGTLPATWLDNESRPPHDWDQSDFGYAIAKLEIAERLRSEHGLKGTVTDFLSFEDECEVSFSGPGYAATARIDRSSGNYTIDILANDLVSILNDLHKGRNTGRAWSWLIDFCAITSTLVAMTGFLLIFFLRVRRVSGLATAAAGVFLLWLFYQVATS